MKLLIPKIMRVKPNDLMKVFSVLSCCGFCISAHAYTVSGNVYSTNGSQADVQAALNAAANGSTIKLPAGTFSWSKTAAKNSIGVTIQGAGVNSTILINTNHGTGAPWVIDLTGSSTPTTITGISFKGNKSLQVGALLGGGNAGTAPFRIYNCSFDSGTEQAILLQVFGNIPGLIDHCTFNGGSASEMIHNSGLGAGNNAGWLDDVSPGSASAVYIENCTFTKDPLAAQAFLGTCAIQSAYGARTVLRYCQLNYCEIDQHGNVPPLYGARWWEFYNNTFYVPPNGNQSSYLGLRGGSGVVFNNHVSGGPNLGAGIIQLYSDEHTNPPLCGPGGGIFVNGSRSFDPVYIWGNDPSMRVASTTSNVIQGRDYLVSSTQPTTMIKRQLTTDAANTTYSYKPYVYPHPLDNGSTSKFGPQ